MPHDRPLGRPQRAAERSRHHDRRLHPRHRGSRLREDQSAHPPVRVPCQRHRHPARQHPLRHVHEQGGQRDAPAHPPADRRQRHRLHQHVPRILCLRPAGGQPRRQLPEELPGPRQLGHRRHARDHLRGARPHPPGHDLWRCTGHDRKPETVPETGIL